MKNKTYPFYLIVIAVFLIIISPTMLSDGMFMDGILYATISKNLANGLGSFWSLHLTSTLYPVFVEHPPLAFGLQSVFFKIFGESILIERFYSLFTFIVTAIIITRIWKKIIIKDFTETAWFPILLWLSIPLSFWTVTNNMLENTMMIFTSLAVLFVLKSLENKQFLNLFISGLFIFCAFLTKGFVGLFPLSFMFWIFVFHREISFKRFFNDSFVILISALLPLIVLYFFVPGSIDSLLAYINRQVVGSISNIQTVESRFYIVIRLISELIPVVLLLLISILFTRKIKFENTHIKWVFIFLFLGLSGVIPIMISLKQSGFYIFATFPFFSIALAILVFPRIQYLMRKINIQGFKFRVFKYLSILLFAVSIFLLFSNINKIGRDRMKIEDVKAVSKIVVDNSLISIEPGLEEDWSLHGYFMRYFSISLVSNSSPNSEFLLINNESNFDVPQNYEQIQIELNLYQLYQKKVKVER